MFTCWKRQPLPPWGPDRRWWKIRGTLFISAVRSRRTPTGPEEQVPQLGQTSSSMVLEKQPQWLIVTGQLSNRQESIRPGQTLSASALSKRQAGLGVPQQLLACTTCSPGPDPGQEVTAQRCPVSAKKINSVKQLRRTLHFSLCSRKVPE